MRFLIVEDEARIASFLQEGLSGEGHTCVVAPSGEDALERLSDGPIDAVILDVGLPRVDGFTVLRAIRDKMPELPVLILTARDDLDSKVAGLAAGADDYLTKPFAFRELVARLQALMRRSRPASLVTVGGFQLDGQARSVAFHGQSVELSDREFVLLDVLMRNANRTLPRDEILRTVWQIGFDPQSTILETTIVRVRRKLQTVSGRAPIETVRGEGYRFVG